MNSPRFLYALGFCVVLWLSVAVVRTQDATDDYHYESDGHLYFDDIDPEIPDYNNTGKYSGGGMTGLFAMVNAFIGAVNSPSMTKYILLVIETAIKGGTFTFAMLYDGLATALVSSAVYLLCIFIGVLFLIVFPVTWIVIFCLRKCGHCGQKTDRRPPKKFFYIYGGIVFVCLIFVLAFTICMSILLNVYLTKYIPEVYFEPFDYLFNDLRAYVAYTAAEFEFILGPEFSYLMDEVSGLMADVPIDGGQAASEAFQAFIVDDADTFSTAQTEAIDYMAALTTELATILTLGQSIKSALESVQSEGTSLGAACGGTCVTIADTVDAHTTAWLATYDAIDTDNPMDTVSIPDIFVITWEDTSEGMDNVTERDVANGITTVLDSYYLNDIGDLRAEVNLISTNAEAIVLDDVESEIDLLQAIVEPYLAELEAQVDVYSGYKDLLFSVTLIVMFILFSVTAAGLILGVLSYDPEEMPSERNMRSHIAGILLIISCIVSIIVVIVFMAICVGLFTFLMPINTVCVEMLSTDIMMEFDKAELFESENNTGVYQTAADYLGEYMFNDTGVSMYTYDILHACADNTAAFQVTKMWLLSVYTDGVAVYEEAVDNYDDIVVAIKDGLVVRLDSDNLFSDDFEASLAFQPSDLDLSGVESFLDEYDTWVSGLQDGYTDGSDTYESVSDLSSTVSSDAGSISDAGGSSSASSISTDLSAIVSGDLATLATALTNAHTELSNLDSSLTTLETAAVDLNTTLTNLTVWLDDIALPVIKDSIVDELDIIEDYIIDYFDYFVYEVNNTVAGCQYVSNMYWTFTHALCSYTMNPLNAVWFLCGALAVFYAPISAFVLKLSSSLRRQEDVEEDFVYDASKGGMVYDVATHPRMPMRAVRPNDVVRPGDMAGLPPPPMAVHAAPIGAMAPIVYRKPNGPPVLLPRIEVKPSAQAAGQQVRTVESRDAAFIRKD